MRAFAGVCIGLFFVVVAQNVAAAPCAGFTDVDDSSPFCLSVTWIKNRGVTLGCTSMTAYCPNDAVNRLAMAAFMKRLGDAMLPEFLAREEVALNVDVSVGAYVCTVGGVPITGHKRIAHLDATLDLIASNFPATFYVQPVVSYDGGVTWNLTTVLTQAVHTPLQIGNGSAMSRAVTLLPGDNLAIGLFLSRAPGTTANLLSVACLLRATIFTSRDP